jgi:hypothetical protein
MGGSKIKCDHFKDILPQMLAFAGVDAKDYAERSDPKSNVKYFFQ